MAFHPGICPPSQTSAPGDLRAQAKNRSDQAVGVADECRMCIELWRNVERLREMAKAECAVVRNARKDQERTPRATHRLDEVPFRRIFAAGYFERGKRFVVAQPSQVVQRRFRAVGVNGVGRDCMRENLQANRPADVGWHHLQGGYRGQKVERVETGSLETTR